LQRRGKERESEREQELEYFMKKFRIGKNKLSIIKRWEGAKIKRETEINQICQNRITKICWFFFHKRVVLLEKRKNFLIESNRILKMKTNEK